MHHLNTCWCALPAYYILHLVIWEMLLSKHFTIEVQGKQKIQIKEQTLKQHAIGRNVSIS